MLHLYLQIGIFVSSDREEEITFQLYEEAEKGLLSDSDTESRYKMHTFNCHYMMSMFSVMMRK